MALQGWCAPVTRNWLELVALGPRFSLVGGVQGLCRHRCHLSMPTGCGLDTHMAPGLWSATTDITFVTSGTPSPLLLTASSTAMADDPCHSLLFYPEFLCFSFFLLSTTHFAVPQSTCSGSPPAKPFLYSCSCTAVWCFSQGHSTISARSGLWRTPGPTLCTKQGQSQSYSKLLRALSSWVLNISKDGESTTILGNLFQCLTTLTVKNILPCCSLWSIWLNFPFDLPRDRGSFLFSRLASPALSVTPWHTYAICSSRLTILIPVSFSQPKTDLFIWMLPGVSKNHAHLSFIVEHVTLLPFVSFLPFDTLNLLFHLAIFKISKDVPVSSHHLSSCTYQGVQRDQVDHGVLVCRAYPETQVGLPDKQEILFHLFHLLVPFLQVSLAYPHPLKQKQGRSSEQFLNNTAQKTCNRAEGKAHATASSTQGEIEIFCIQEKW